MFLLCDIDGTVADNSHRTPYIAGKPKNWDAFHDSAKVMADLPITRALWVIKNRLLPLYGGKFIFLTGRPARLRGVTKAWLKTHGSIHIAESPAENAAGHPHLSMRPDNDYRSSVEFKESFIKTLRGPFLFLDDDERNIEMYWRYGTYLKAPECWEAFR